MTKLIDNFTWGRKIKKIQGCEKYVSKFSGRTGLSVHVDLVNSLKTKYVFCFFPPNCRSYRKAEKAVKLEIELILYSP